MSQITWKHPRLTFHKHDARTLHTLYGKYDVILLNMVLLNIDSRRDVKKIFQGVRHLLAPKGVLVFSDLHPACVMSGPHPDRWFTFAKKYEYLKEGNQFTAHIRLDRKTSISFTNRHWTIGLYTKILMDTGFAITRITELMRDRKLRYASAYRVPEFILFTAQRHKK